ncbi:MAG: Flp family type IVb pilin [Thermoflexaceae bacterium]|nr:Flp family type IVb pilin [Thermoflexaceae bacterium]
MSKLQNWAARKYIQLTHRDEEGQGLAEYGLILALISVVCILALTALGTNINGTLGAVNAAF